MILFGVARIAANEPALAADSWLDVIFKEAEAPNAATMPKVRLYGASKALIIGIDDYTEKGWPRLSLAIEDAVAIKAALEARGFTVTLLKNLKSADLDRVFKEFFIKEGADPEARLFVWFAGHGHTIDGEGYLVPADAPSPARDLDFRLKALSLRRFGEYMRDAKAKHVLAVFDSCFAGTVFNVARAAPPPAITYATALPVRQFVTSGEAEQAVSDDGEFRRLFIDALDGKERAADPNRDGYITGAELGQFLFDKVTNYTRKAQTPRWGKLNERGYDRGDFVFAKGKLTPPPTATKAQAEPTLSEAAQAWTLIKDSEDISVLDAFRAQYGPSNKFYDQLAASRIAEMEKRLAMLELEPKPEPAQPKAKSSPAACDGVNVAVGINNEWSCLKPGDTFKDCDECPEMVVVPAGSFMMGSPGDEEGRGEDEGPQRKVTIAEPFAVGKFEVTFDEWDACLSARGCKHKPGDAGRGRDRRPVINVSWTDVTKDYLPWLSKRTGKTYRLLTEAEWEYAARANTARRYSWGEQASHEYANYGKDQCCDGRNKGADKWFNAAPVGSFPKNAFGLHDLHGNLWEWVEDCYQNSYEGAPVDGSARTSGDCTSRVLRGGSWGSNPRLLRSAVRFRSRPVHRDANLGFRVVRTLTP